MNQPEKDWFRSDIARLLKFLPVFEDPEFVAGKWRPWEVGPGTHSTVKLTGPDYSPRLLEFCAFIEKSSTDLELDAELYGAILDYGRPPSGFDNADLTTIRRWLVVFARGERFCDGFMLSEFLAGAVTAALKRLQVLEGAA